jgi:tyrosinase
MLRNECGYKGYQPYYNWSWWAKDPKSSGRNYSCFPFETPCLMHLEPGTGGGCVTSGPFKE